MVTPISTGPGWGLRRNWTETVRTRRWGSPTASSMARVAMAAT
jgi:hypothetical protein